ncbi:hypothetical protein BaRGS_00014542 [Batillaria attramentaria]|uniref:Uncharacterized protein n=1 Tax=Batillaria attramentaria TaxID=370345 RepID=A0ABD0L538_9CAEN
MPRPLRMTAQMVVAEVSDGDDMAGPRGQASARRGRRGSETSTLNRASGGDRADGPSAENHADELFAATGLQIVDAGVGKGVTVEVKKKDGGYVVLTFILVGSIAGVVLAVTIIYLLKRHRRSREKLAQLAATGDGNEASKDYQDLCRQRMQSKASEKPEPLHAASRIGSVSESQVRSPSSRSSTSSCWPAGRFSRLNTGRDLEASIGTAQAVSPRIDPRSLQPPLDQSSRQRLEVICTLNMRAERESNFG